MRRVYSLLMSASACALIGHSALAQVNADSTTTFRAGEWGVGFIQRSGLTEGGVFRFSTPTRAWVLDGSGSFGQTNFPGAGLFGADESTQTVSINASLGPRWYRAISPRVVRFVGLGVSGGYAHVHSSQNDAHDTNWSAGGYGEVGMLYMFSRHLGLGWRATLLAARAEDHNDAVGSTTQHTSLYTVSVQPIQLVGTIYF